METRQAIHSAHAKTLDTQGLREQFLVTNLFRADDFTLTYSHIDRIIVGGIAPVSKTVSFPSELGKTFGTAYLLERREFGAINIGGNGWVEVDGTRYQVGSEEAIYIGKGTKTVTFGSENSAMPAKFYYTSAPAHQTFPTRIITIDQASPETLGDIKTCNRRTIYKFIVPDVLPTCQLSMGMTKLEEGCNWNTMPCHTHERRMEVYFYFRLPENAAVFHLLGEPQETRHIVVHNEQAIISPSWSIHSGVGTQNYTFIWAMVGENQTFHDMDHIAIKDLR